MFAAAEYAARRIWDVNPYCSHRGHVEVSWYTFKASS